MQGHSSRAKAAFATTLDFLNHMERRNCNTHWVWLPLIVNTQFWKSSPDFSEKHYPESLIILAKIQIYFPFRASGASQLSLLFLLYTMVHFVELLTRKLPGHMEVHFLRKFIHSLVETSLILKIYIIRTYVFRVCVCKLTECFKCVSVFKDQTHQAESSTAPIVIQALNCGC